MTVSRVEHVGDLTVLGVKSLKILLKSKGLGDQVSGHKGELAVRCVSVPHKQYQ